MSSDKLPADNPTSALFDLAEQMADNYRKISYLKYYAYVFILISIILLIVLLVASVASQNFAGVIITLAIIISGVMLLRLVIFTIKFLDDFHSNFEAIKLVREIDPLPKIPRGKTIVDRLEAYLKNDDPIISRELRIGMELHRDHDLGAKRWSLALFRRDKSFGFGPKGFLILVSKVAKTPKLADFIKLEKDLEAVMKQFMAPNRVILLCKANIKYDGISDDLYSYLTEKSHYILKNGNKVFYKLQLFVETEGRYEIIPLIP
jgi:hypothetical protein